MRRKAMIASICILIFALGFTLALLAPRTYTYSTSIEIGSQIIDGTVEPFESPETLLAKLNYSFIPKTLNDLSMAGQENKQSYKITASVPRSSKIIVLQMKGTEDQAEILGSILQSISKRAIQDHQRIYDAVKLNYVSSKNQAESELANLDVNSNENAEKIQRLKNRIESYNSQLANLSNTREILPPMRSIDPTGVSKKLVVIVTAFLGIFLGVFAAFFFEFLAKVKEVSSQ
jgi:uncharacterized protein involved in exopolysaccharide biosynthesis